MTTITSNQELELSRHYQINPTPNRTQKGSIASDLGLTLQQVELWFLQMWKEDKRKEGEKMIKNAKTEN